MLWLFAFAEIIPVEPDKVMLDRGMSLFGVSPLYAYLRKGAFNFSHMQGEKVLQPVTIKRSKQMKDLLSLGKDALKTVINALKEFSLYLTIAVFAIMLIAFLVIYFKNKAALPAFKKFAVGVTVAYSITLVAIIMYVQIARMKVKGETDGAFWLFVGYFITLLVVVAVGVILNKYAPKAYKYFVYIAFAAVVAYTVALVVSIRYTKSYGENKVEPLHKTAYYIISAVLVVAIIALSFIFGKDEGTASTSKNLAYAGVCIALSFALSYVKFFSLPMGGSITLASMLPLMLYSYMFGARKGVFAGLIYGILQFIQNPQVYEWMQILLDYPIAFSAIGLAGIAKNFKFLKGNMFAEIIVGMAIACLFRYISHVVSGYFVFGVWGNDWKMDPIAYSFAYNSFVFVDLAIDIVAGVLILSTKSMRNVISNVNPKPVTLDNTVEA